MFYNKLVLKGPYLFRYNILYILEVFGKIDIWMPKCILFQQRIQIADTTQILTPFMKGESKYHVPLLI